MNSFSYHKAPTTVDAIQQKTNIDVKADFIAGGTNIIDLMKYFVTSPNHLIDINGLQTLQQITELPDGGVRLGALVTNAATAYHPLIEARYPLLSKAILAGASAQIRNMATNGGNLLQRTRCYYFYDINTPCNKRNPGAGCSAIKGHSRIMAILGTSESCIAVFPSDMCVALAALNAVVNITGPAGNRTLHFAEFHRLPGNTPDLDNNLKHDELITSIDLPKKGFSENYAYLKVRDRNSYAFALVSAATALHLENDIIIEARIALGGVAHKPWRSTPAEEFLKGKTANAQNFAIAADMILEGATSYPHNGFKIKLAKNVIIQNAMTALNGASL